MANSQALPQEHETYAISAAWQQQAELLAHLSQFSQNVLCVVAPPDMGKTRFLHYFMRQAHTGLRKHVILQPPTKVDELMQAVAKSFELPWAHQNSNTLQSEVDALNEKRDDTWVLFIDDADKLPEDCLLALLKLVRFDVEPKRQLHLILLGQPELERILYSRGCQELIQGHCHTMELAAHDLLDTEKFSVQTKRRTRLSLDAELLVQEALSKPNSQSKKTNNQGATMSQGTTSPRSIQQYLFHPISFGAAAGIGLGIVYLMLNPLDDMEWQTPETNAAQLAEVTFQSELMAQPNNAPLAKLKVEVLTESIPEEELVNQQTITSKGIPLTEQVPELVRSNTDNELVEMAQVVQSVQKVSKAKKQSDNTVATNNFSDEEQYLLNVEGSRYTLQLMGGASEAGLKQFIKKNQLEHKAYTYRKEVNGQSWYVVVLGDYQSRQEASQAAQQLPATVKQTVKPWVRSIGNIQSEIKAGQG